MKSILPFSRLVRNNMKIGTRLKEIRQSKGLDQKEMSAHIMDRSFYSRVEANKNKIRINHLIRILNYHHIPLIKFFTGFGNIKPENSVYEERIREAYYQHDLDQLRAIRDDSNFSSEKIKQVAGLLLDELNGVHQFSGETKHKLRYNSFRLGAWDADTLWILSMSMVLYDFDELSGIVDSIFNRFAKQKIEDGRILELLADVSVAYLQFCLANRRKKADVKVALDFLQELPDSTLIFLQKMLGKYYQALFDNDVVRAKKLHDMLLNMGYQNYLK